MQSLWMQIEALRDYPYGFASRGWLVSMFQEVTNQQHEKKLIKTQNSDTKTHEHTIGNPEPWLGPFRAETFGSPHPPGTHIDPEIQGESSGWTSQRGKGGNPDILS